MPGLNHHLLTGITTPVLLRLVRRHGLDRRPGAWAGFARLFLDSLWATAAAAADSRRYGRLLARMPVPADPLVIVGHWRTGSTFLHQLLALDPGLAAPTVFQCSLPDGFLSAERYVRPVMAAWLPATRPMDGVRLGTDEPMEDEFALLRMTGRSPLEQLFFGRRPGYFLNDYGEDTGENAEWDAALVLFLKKLHLRSGQRIVLKNPLHSGRIGRLRRLFPGAKFINITRDPRRSIPSTVRMWDIIGRRNSLGRTPAPPTTAEAVSVFRRLTDGLSESLAALPPGDSVDVRFEDLERDPLRTLGEIYGRLGLEMAAAHEVRVADFMAANSGFRHNAYALSPADELLIEAELGKYLRRHGYDRSVPLARGAATPEVLRETSPAPFRRPG